MGPVTLTHHVESVKFLPPQGFAPNEPARYGIVTQSAASLAEIGRPGVARTFCIATSTTDFEADSPSSWSGAIDQLASGSMLGEWDDKKEAKDLPKRLVLVAAGNTPVGIRDEVLQHHSIEDPAQSWNALTVGGYTTMTESPADQPNLVPLGKANDRSPFSRGSQNLVGDLTPIKPEVLFEAGNMLVDDGNFCIAHPAVSILGTGSDIAGEPLVPFCATSAATAIAGNFVGQLQAALPGLWPETYRALVVHSAEWPQPIRARLVGKGAHWKTGAKSEKNLILRDVGFGVPNLRRAISSARSDVTILAQAEIQPFASGQNNSAVFNDMHFYALPWPVAALGTLANDIVTMKVTLSYFVEPNLSGRAATRPETYRSFGLRFELKKRLETGEDFRLRLSKPDHDEGEAEGDAVEVAAVEAKAKQPVEPSHWLLGPKAASGGSLHCDLWRRYGVDLASFNHLAVYPVGGWWRTHLGKKRMNDTARYSLAVSLSVEGQNVDLLTEIAASVQARTVPAAVLEVPIEVA